MVCKRCDVLVDKMRAEEDKKTGGSNFKYGVPNSAPRAMTVAQIRVVTVELASGG